MRQLIRSTNVYKVAWLKLVIGTYLAGLAVWSSGQYTWTSMSQDEKINTLLCISGAMGTFVLGFFDRTLSRIDAEQKQKNETQFIVKP